MSLTKTEQRAMDLTAELMGVMSREIIADGPARARDLSEAVLRIHSIQHMIMAQAAARAHPNLYRLLGSGPARVCEMGSGETATQVVQCINACDQHVSELNVCDAHASELRGDL